MSQSWEESIKQVSDKSKDYEQLVLQHDKLYSDIVNVIAIVKDYIRCRGYIIYGGTAIDFALRLKGDKIYPDSSLAVADLDFFSSNSVSDAYMLADILYEKGYENVRVIRARYVRTMRVDLADGHYIADISYMPPDVFAKVPTIEYDGMKIVHPDFQKVDLHSSLSGPYDNPPQEVIFERWKKDIQRFNLMDKYYSTKAAPDNDKMLGTLIIRGVAVPEKMRKNVLHGMAAYALLCKYYIGVFGDDSNVFKCGVEESKGGELTFDLLARHALPHIESANIPIIDIIHFDIHKACEELSLSDVVYYHPYINLLPERAEGIYETGNNTYPKIYVRIHSSKGKLVSINTIEHKYRVANVQYLLKYILSLALITEQNKITQKQSQIYYRIYHSIHYMISMFEKKFKTDEAAKNSAFAKLSEAATDAELSGDINPFFPSVYTFGRENQSLSYEVSLNKTLSDMKHDESDLVPMPYNYYPNRSRPNNRPHPEFDYSKSVYFLESGAPIHNDGRAHDRENNNVAKPVGAADELFNFDFNSG